MALSQQWLDELRSRTTLSNLIGKTLKLSKAGREFKGCCPFHNEKTASFYVNDEKQMYHCFGCSAHGDAIRWMTEQRGLSFIDAVKDLADAAGMEVPERSASAKKEDDRRVKLIEATEAAARWFEEQLATPAAADVRAYIEKRGFSKELCHRFRIGFAPDKRDGLKTALSSFPEQILIEAGLLISVEDKAPYDRFRGRLMIPIKDPRGRVIAFGGRIMGDGQPKYLNSPDTPLFDKGKALYNFDKASPASRKSGCLVGVEGYLDAIACAKAGIDEAVAPLGTALTERQLELMWMLCSNPVLCFDGDSAGRKASVRAAERALPLLQPGRSLSFARLPDGQDPDDIISKSGPAAFRVFLSQSVSLVEMIWTHAIETMPSATPEEKAAVKAYLRDSANAIKHPDVRKGYLDEFGQRLKVHFSPPRQEQPEQQGAYQPRVKKEVAPRRDLTGALSGLDDILQRSVVALCLRFPDLCAKSFEGLVGLSFNPELSALVSTISEFCMENPRMSSGDVLAKLIERDLRDAADDLLGDHQVFFRDMSRDDADTKLRAMIDIDSLTKSEARARHRMQETGTPEDIATFRKVQEQLQLTRRALAN